MGILKKLLDHAVDVVNPNTPSDKLKRAAAGQSSEYIKGQPAKIPSRNDEPGFQFRNNSLTRGASRVFDQLNMADNNRTWSQRTPTNDRSYWGQGYDIGKKVVKPFYETGDFAMQSAQVGLHNAFGDPNSEEAQIDRAKRDASYNESIVPSVSRAVWQLRESNPVDRAWGTTPTYMKERDTNNKAEDYIKQGYSPEAVQAWKTQELDNWYQESLRKAGFNMNDTSAQVYAKSFGDIGSTAGYVVSPAAGAMVNGPKAIIGESVRQGVFNAIPNMASAYGQGGSFNDIATSGATGFGMGTLLTGAGYVAPRIIPGARNSGDVVSNTPVNRIDQPNVMKDPRVAAFDDNLALLNEARQKALAEGMSPNTALVKNNDKAFKATTIAKQEAAKNVRDGNQAGFIGKNNNEPTIRNVFGEEVPNPGKQQGGYIRVPRGVKEIDVERYSGNKDLPDNPEHGTFFSPRGKGSSDYGDIKQETKIAPEKTFTSSDQETAIQELFSKKEAEAHMKKFEDLETNYDPSTGGISNPGFNYLDKTIAKKLKSTGHDTIHYLNDRGMNGIDQLTNGDSYVSLDQRNIKGVPGDIVRSQPGIAKQEAAKKIRDEQPTIKNIFGEDVPKPGKDQGGYIQMPSGKQVDEPLYHGSPDADKIRENGFVDTPPKPGTSRIYGDGTYLTNDKNRAALYGGGRYAGPVDKNVVNANVPKDAKIYKPKDVTKEIFGKDTNYGDPKLISEKYKKLGYDGIEISRAERMKQAPENQGIDSFNTAKNQLEKEVIMFDSKKVSVANDAPQVDEPLYHGTNKTAARSINKTGYRLTSTPREFKGYFDKEFSGQKGYISLSNSLDGAKRYATSRGTVIENNLSPNAKVVDFDDIPSAYKKRIIEINELYNSGLSDEEWLKKGYSRPRLNAEINGILEKYAKDNNVDGIKFGESLSQRIVEPGEVRIYNPGAINISAPQVGKTLDQRGSVNPGAMIDDAKNAASKIKKLLKERKEAMIAGSSEYAYAAEQKLKALGYDVDAQIEAPKTTTRAPKVDAPLSRTARSGNPMVDEVLGPKITKITKDTMLRESSTPGEASVYLDGVLRNTEPELYKQIQQRAAASGYPPSFESQTPTQAFLEEQYLSLNKDLDPVNILNKAKNPMENITPTKKSSFAQGVTRSKEISDPLKASVKKSAPDYVPIENADLVKASEAFVKKGYKKAATEIGERLNVKEGKISGQDVADAIHVIKKLDEKGGTANIQLATDLSEKLSMHLTKAGQTIQAASLLSNRTPEGMLYGARKFLAKNGIEVTDEINKTLKSKIDEIRAAKTHEDKLYRIAELQAIVEKQVPSSNLDKGIGLWKAGLLTGIKSQTGNTLSGISTNLMKLPADALASPLDMAFEKLGKTQFGKKLGFEGQRSKAFTVRGVKEGAVEGVQKGWKSLRTGIDERNMETSKFDTKRLVFGNSKAGKAAQVYTDTVYGLMGAADRPNYYINLRRNLNDLGIVEAMNKGLKGPERAKFLKEYLANPPAKAFQEATDAAEKAVFANDTQLSKWAGSLRQASEDKPIAKAAINIAMPFTKVPSAVAMRMVDYSPVGAVKTLIEQISKVKKTGAIDQRALVEGLSEAGIGTGAMVLGYKLKEAGLMTGSYPKDPKEQELWKLEGKQPNSIKIGNGWKSINYTSPAGQVIANGSKIYDAYAEGKRGLDLVSSSAAAGAKTLTEQSFLQGVQGALDVISDPERSAYKYIKNTAGSVIPTISSDIAKATTGTQKRVDDIKDSIVSRIPIANRTLSDKIDAFGEPLKRQSNSVNTMVDPFRTSDVKDPNPLNTELRRLQDAGFGVMPTPVDKKISFGSKEKGNLEEFVLTPDQQDAMNKKIGKITKERWNQIIATDSYKQMNDREKQKALSDLLTDARALGKADYASKNKPELLDKVDLTKKQISLGTSSGVDNYLISPKDRKDADVAKQVEEFKNSDSNSKIIGKNYYYKDKDGEVRKKSSAQYEYDKVDSKANLEMDRAKDSGNLDAWSESANKKLEAMKTLYRTLDKNTEQDKIDDLTLKIENLYSDINKYTSYGGFKKGGSGSKSGSKSDYFSKIANLEKKSSNAALRSILTKRQYQTKAKIYKARTA